MAKKEATLPETVYVQRGGDGEETWLAVEETVEDALGADLEATEAGEEVGVYKLEKRIRITPGPTVPPRIEQLD